MEHIAGSLNLDPLAVRMTNMDMNDNPLPEMIEDLKIKAQYDDRRRIVNEFNVVSYKLIQIQIGCSGTFGVML
jgi:xanthine dehydrogenase molybdopterin-binding subunit B